MTKQQQIFNLYDTLTIYKAKGLVRSFIADVCETTLLNVRTNWFQDRQFPKNVTSEQLDEIESYLNELHIEQKDIEFREKASDLIEALTNLVNEVKGCELDDNQKEAVKQSELVLNNLK